MQERQNIPGAGRMDSVPQQVVPPQPPTNPLLERARIPGQTFQLPSKAVFYTNGEVADDVIDSGGEVMIYPMVTVDELVMKTPDRLLNGTALSEVFSRCIPQIQRSELLLAKDVDFLLICLRRVTYGEEFVIEYTHNCENAKEHTYVIPLDQIIKSGGTIDEKTARKQYRLTLPNQQTVQVAPPRYFQMLKFYQALDREQVDEHEVAEQVLDGVLAIVEQVDNITDKHLIREWLQQLPAGYVKQISEHVGKMGQWGPDLTHGVKCRDCNADVELTLSLNPISFFS